MSYEKAYIFTLANCGKRLALTKLTLIIYRAKWILK